MAVAPQKINYGKIIAVIFITVLIWIYADRATDKSYTLTGANITIADQSATPKLWRSFAEQSSKPIDKIELKGPASKIEELKRKLNNGTINRTFFLYPENEKDMDGKELNLLSFFKKNDKIRKLGLTVESCEPASVTLTSIILVEKDLNVVCRDEKDIDLKASITPGKVSMFVPEDWERDKLTTIVELTSSDIDQARTTQLERIPYIKLGDQIRKASKSVTIRISSKNKPLNVETIKTPTVGIIFSLNTQEKYYVDIKNHPEIIALIKILATPAAKQAYEEMTYHVILEIYDTDKDDAAKGKVIKRPLIYNFPPEFVGKEEIKQFHPPVEAEFMLLPVGSAPPS